MRFTCRDSKKFLEVTAAIKQSPISERSWNPTLGNAQGAWILSDACAATLERYLPGIRAARQARQQAPQAQDNDIQFCPF